MSFVGRIMALFKHKPHHESVPPPPLPQEQRAIEQKIDRTKRQAIDEMERAVQNVVTITAESLGRLYESRKAGEKIARKMQRRNEG